MTAFQWERLDPLTAAMTGEGAAAAEAAAVVNRVRAALSADEIVTPIGKALRDAETDAFAWLTRGVTPPPPAPPPPPVPPLPANGGHGIRRAGEDDEAVLGRVRGFLADHPSVDVDVTWQVRE